jgi:uncharacterized protein (TIGR03118 family)
MAAGRQSFCLAAALMALVSASRVEAQTVYKQINLISDLPGVAQLLDTNLVNAWGISFSSSSPFWVSDNGTGLATVYQITNNAAGHPLVKNVGLNVEIPPVGQGTPTGQAFNTIGGFNGDIFLFVSEDGTISGWRGALGTTAETLVPGITNNVYKGMALSSNASGGVLLAANFRQGTVDMYNTSATLLGQFSDPSAPAGYAPFGMQSIDGIIFVTFAKQDDVKHDDAAGPGNGLIDTFDPVAGTFHRFATGSSVGGAVQAMNSPWGVALAPATFGQHANQLLVGNFGAGTIMTFDAGGNFRGLLHNLEDEPVKIDGLWGLIFGNGKKAGVPGTLYFSAGPFGESHGLFGSLQPVNENKQH